MRGVDKQEKRIIRNLIKDPRISDNALAKKTGIPIVTVNRKRKRLEKEGYLNYYVDFDMSEEGTHVFHAKQLYVVQLKSGITRKKFLNYLATEHKTKTVFTKYIVESHLGEQSGRLAYIVTLEAETEIDLTEIFNGLLVAGIKKQFGHNAVTHITTVKLNSCIRQFRNYISILNKENGKMTDDWPEDLIYVSSKQKEEDHRMGAIYDLYDFEDE
jgi:DNA-binding Lrp family transcriptional regulator